MLDFLPIARKDIRCVHTYRVSTPFSVEVIVLEKMSGVIVYILPATSHPGSRVGSRQSFSTTRAARYMSSKVAVSDCW